MIAIQGQHHLWLFGTLRRAILCAACVSVLIGCRKESLDLQEDGRVIYTGQYPTTHSLNETGGRFVKVNDCILFEAAGGKRLLPIFRPGLRFGTEDRPGKLRLDTEYAVGGIDPGGKLAAGLHDDPVAERCGAPPTFIADVAAPRAGPPPPPPPS